MIAFECLGMALRHCNKTAEHQFTAVSFRVLLAAYNASEAGLTLSRKGLVDRLDAMANVRNQKLGYQLVYRLVLKGMLEEQGIGKGAIVVPSLSGRNYVRAVERYLKNLRPGSY